MSLENEQLLMLDTLVYYKQFSDRKCITEDETYEFKTVGDFVNAALDQIDEIKTCFNGALSYSDDDLGIYKILQLIRADKQLMDLIIVYPSQSNDESTSSVCLLDTSDGKNDVYIIFGGNYADGTYDYNNQELKTWTNNFLGAVLTDTDEQTRDMDFYVDAIKQVRKELGDSNNDYSGDLNITVSGHSTAGNHAQYVTIAFPRSAQYSLNDDIDRCVSFDGQGFSLEFLSEYSSEIKDRAELITCINPNVSIVGSLMYTLPGINEKYIDIGEQNCAVIGYHMPSSMLDDNGNFLPEAVKGIEYYGLKYFSLMITESTKEYNNPLINQENAYKGLGDFVYYVTSSEEHKILKALGALFGNKDSILLSTTLIEETIITGAIIKDIAIGHPYLTMCTIAFSDCINSTEKVKWYIDNGYAEEAVKEGYSCLSRLAIGFETAAVCSSFGPLGTILGFGLGWFGGDIIADLSWDIGEIISEGLETTWKDICDFWGFGYDEDWKAAINARILVDPLILDLDFDGFNIESKKYGTYFDLNCDGFAERINWTSKDAILSIDLNRNGIIDNGREVFGDYHLLTDGTKAENGFEALAQYDFNGDGIIDKNDEIFSELRLWVDGNSDGISEYGELKTLNEMGIKSISLDYVSANQSTGTEALIGNTATFVYEDDITGQIGEMWVASDLFDTIETVITGLSEAVDGIPDVRSYGHISSLHNAISQDQTGLLKELVDMFNSETNNSVRIDLVKKILDFMCDTDNIEEGSRGSNFSAKKLAVIEKFMGEGFMGVNGENPNTEAAPILESVYNQIVDMYCFAMIGSNITDYLNLISMIQDDDGTFKLSCKLLELYLDCALKHEIISEKEFSDICSYICYYDSNILDDHHMFYEFRDYFEKYNPQYVELIDASAFGAINGDEKNNVINGTTSADLIYGNDGNDTLIGGNGNDFLIGGLGDDILYGSSNDDVLLGYEGNDILDAGTGNDILNGGSGDDTYIFAKGYGNDVVIDSEGLNTLKFKGLKSSDISVNGTGDNDVTVTINGTNDMLVLKDFRKGDEYKNYNLEFDDVKMFVTDKNSPFRHIYGGSGNDILKAAVEDSVMHAFGGNDTVYGSKGNDVIYGNEGDDTIYAGNRNDYVYGGEGNDTIDGESGNDFLYGGSGDDTYIFGKNYGTDIINDTEGVSTIRLADGISLADLKINAVGENAIIGIKDTADKLIISNFAANPENYVLQIGNEKIFIKDNISAEENEFVSGSGNYDYIVNEDKTVIAGGASGDRIIGSDNDEYIFGDSGDDQLLAGDGNDVVFGGDGSDYINGGNGDDVIDAGAGNDFIDGGNGNDVYIFNPNSGHNTIKDSNGENTIMFGDGFKADEIKAYRSNWNDLLIRFDGSEDTLTIKNYCIDENARNFTLVFADGTVVNAADKNSPLKTIYGTDNSDYMPSIYKDGITKVGDDGNDQLVGSDGNDFLYGENGDDRLTGNGGNDILDGGEDNDFLYGGSGDDTYIFQKGYGTDTIGDGDGMNTIEIKGYSTSQIKAYRTNWNDITLTFEDSDDKLVIEGFFANEANRNFYLNFDNGSKIHATASNSPLRTIYGTENGDYIAAMDDRGVTLIGENGNDNLNGGNGSDKLFGGEDDDQLYGNGGKDILDGGQGNDFLYGGNGDDTYVFNAGYGVDTIIDSEGINTISFGDDLTANKLTAYRTDWNNLTVAFDNSDDKLVIKDYFVNENNRNFNVNFANGTKFAYDNSENPIKQVHATEYDDWMTAWSENGIVLHGDGGNDHLTGGKGDDTLSGGIGSDYLAGGEGNDTYIFGNGFGSDIVEDNNGENKIMLQDLNADDVTFSVNNGELTVKINNSDDVLTIINFDSERFTFEFADDVNGTVNTAGEFLETVSEETIIQNNADVLSDIYSDYGLTTDSLDGYADTVIPEMTDASALSENDENLFSQTDIQVMILTENMAGFADENKVSEGVNFSDTNENANSMNQLMVNTQAQ